MSEKLKELLERINQEGVKQAEEKSKEIEYKSKKDAERLIEAAKRQADDIIEQAKLDAKKTKDATEIALRQASRDLLLSIKDEVVKIFDRIVGAEIEKVISREDMALILEKVIENYIEKSGKASDITVLLKEDDLEKLKNTFISKLKERLKGGIEFKPSKSINAGFFISFDKGKSFFDFSSEALQEALCAYLNPEIAKLLKGI